EVRDIITDTIDLASLFSIGIHNEPVVTQVSLKTPDKLEVTIGGLIVAEVGSGLLPRKSVPYSTLSMGVWIINLPKRCPQHPRWCTCPHHRPRSHSQKRHTHSGHSRGDSTWQTPRGAHPQDPAPARAAPACSP